jgi:hypothetical protein
VKHEHCSQHFISHQDTPQLNHTGDSGSQTTDTIQIRKEADENLSTKEQDIKKFYIKQIKDEVIQCATAQPGNCAESRLVYAWD